MEPFLPLLGEKSMFPSGLLLVFSCDPFYLRESCLDVDRTREKNQVHLDKIVLRFVGPKPVFHGIYMGFRVCTVVSAVSRRVFHRPPSRRKHVTGRLRGGCRSSFVISTPGRSFVSANLTLVVLV